MSDQTYSSTEMQENEIELATPYVHPGAAHTGQTRAIRSRLDFSKIPTAIQIPNLIEVQRRSYERFLQMDKLPQEREDNGLQSVFTSVFPITDFRNVSELEFVDYSIGNWECKCGYLKGAEPPAHGLHQLRPHGHYRPVPPGRCAVQLLRHVQQEHAGLLHQVR